MKVGNRLYNPQAFLGMGRESVAAAIFEHSGRRKLRAEKLEAWQVDELCDRFNVTAV